MYKPMLPAAVGLWLLLLPLSVDFALGDTRQPTKETLSARVADYYKAFSGSQFRRVWGFLGPAIREEQTEEQFVQGLKVVLKKIVPVGPAHRLELGQTGQGQHMRPLGTVAMPVDVIARDAPIERVQHITSWVWQDFDGRRDWFFIADRFEADRRLLGGIGSSIPTAALSDR